MAESLFKEQLARTTRCLSESQRVLGAWQHSQRDLQEQVVDTREMLADSRRLLAAQTVARRVLAHP